MIRKIKRFYKQVPQSKSMGNFYTFASMMKQTPLGSKIRPKTLHFIGKVKQYNVVAAIEKIAFTAIGLLLALWINNWNEKIKKQEIERQTLLEIKSGLEQDRKDIIETIGGFEYRLYATGFILEHLNDSMNLTQELLQQFNGINGYSFLLANTGAYETLKSRGIETIKNDSLRLRIATLYDVKYEKAQRVDSFSEKIFTDQIFPYLIRHFTQTGEVLQPIDFQKIKKDNTYRELVFYVRYASQNGKVLYSEILKEVEQIIASIDEHIQ